MTLLYDSILLAITAWVYVHILMDRGMILEWWGKLLTRLPEKIADPLGLCEYCVGGQFALWYYLYYNLNEYSVVNHIIFISLTIFLIEVINYGSKAVKLKG